MLKSGTARRRTHQEIEAQKKLEEAKQEELETKAAAVDQLAEQIQEMKEQLAMFQGQQAVIQKLVEDNVLVVGDQGQILPKNQNQ